MKIYIAGPMTGLPDFNYPAFYAAEEELAAMGHETFNPARTEDGITLEQAIAVNGTNEAPAHPWEHYIRIGLLKMMQAEALVVLPGWQNSRGAVLEVNLANTLSMPVYVLRDGRLLPRVEIIGLSGYARSGKDTIGSALAARGWQRASLGDKIREALYTLNPIAEGPARVRDLVDAQGWETAKTQFPEIRALLQRLGGDVTRGLGLPALWSDLTFADMADGAKIVITDCRFPNEAHQVHALGGQMWRVTRPGFEPANAHPGEVALDDFPFDVRIDNDGTMADLREKVHAIMDKRPQ